MAVVCCIMIVPVFVHKIHSLNPNEQRWLLCHISGKKKNVDEKVDKVAFLKWQSLEFVWWRKNEAQQHFASRHIAFYMWLCSVHTVHTQWSLSMAWKLEGAKKSSESSSLLSRSTGKAFRHHPIKMGNVTNGVEKRISFIKLPTNYLQFLCRKLLFQIILCTTDRQFQQTYYLWVTSNVCLCAC